VRFGVRHPGVGMSAHHEIINKYDLNIGLKKKALHHVSAYETTASGN